jgi:hypothetical protein
MVNCSTLAQTNYKFAEGGIFYDFINSIPDGQALCPQSGDLEFYGVSGTSLWIDFKDWSDHKKGQNFVEAYMVTTNFDIEEWAIGNNPTSMK